MNFFYLDETGCTGADLNNPEQPIFVLGGISVRDEGWRTTTADINNILLEYLRLPPFTPTGLRLLPVSGGAFAGHQSQHLPRLTGFCLLRGFATLDRGQQQTLLSRAMEHEGIDMCIFAAADMTHFRRAWFQLNTWPPIPIPAPAPVGSRHLPLDPPATAWT